MPMAPPKHCPHGHPPFTGRRCPACKGAADAARPNARARGYDGAWERARAEYLAANPVCIVAGCGCPSVAVDHKVPHRGDARLFWDRNNWQAMCTPHHNAKTAREDGGFGRRLLA